MTILIDQLLPVYDYNEIHKINIRNQRDKVYSQLIHMDLNRSWITKTLFFLRGLHHRDLSLSQMLSQGPFKLLEENQPHELVIGLLTNTYLKPALITDKAFFLEYAPKNGLKIAWNFSIAQGTGNGLFSDESCELSTETRIQCLGPNAKTFFSLYWFFIKPFSGIIRREMLKAIKNQAEN